MVTNDSVRLRRFAKDKGEPAVHLSGLKLSSRLGRGQKEQPGGKR